jgi:PqqD family protein of HPr-rel-A system
MNQAVSNSDHRQSKMTWRAIPDQSVRVRSWDDDSVVYNIISGDTHLLGAAAGHILTQLQRAPFDEAALVESLCETLQVELCPELPLHIRSILADLHKLALIEEVA